MDDFSEIASKIDSFAMCMKSRLAAAYVNKDLNKIPEDGLAPEVDEACRAFIQWMDTNKDSVEFGDPISVKCENYRNVPVDLMKQSVSDYLKRKNRLFGFLTTSNQIEHYSRLSHTVIDLTISEDGTVMADILPILGTRCGVILDHHKNCRMVGRIKGIVKYHEGEIVDYTIYSVDVHLLETLNE